MRQNLVLLANGASFDVVCDPFLHSGPVVVLLGLLQCFVPSWMSCGWVIVYEMHDASLDFVEGRYEGFSFWDGCCDFEFFWCEDCDVLVILFSSVCSRGS